MKIANTRLRGLVNEALGLIKEPEGTSTDTQASSWRKRALKALERES